MGHGQSRPSDQAGNSQPQIFINADSNLKYNTYFEEYLIGCEEAKSFSESVVQSLHGDVNFLCGDSGEVPIFWGSTVG
jgi:hypothetical protein